MHKFDAPAASARIPKWILGVARVPANPAHVLFLLLLIIVLGWHSCRSRHRRGRLDLLSLGTARRRSGGGGRGGWRGRRRRGIGECLDGDGASVEGRRWFVSDLHDGLDRNGRGPSRRWVRAGQGESRWGRENEGEKKGGKRWEKMESDRRFCRGDLGFSRDCPRSVVIVYYANV